MLHNSNQSKTNHSKFEYLLNADDLKTFADPSLPFLTFAHFVEIVRWYRDYHFALQNVRGFRTDCGSAYQVWTRSTTSSYLRHIFPNEITEPVVLSFEIPKLESPAWFPLRVEIYDNNGTYFIHEQQLVIERNIGDRMAISSWQKVPAIRDFLLVNAIKADNTQS